jgi:hypothetical protein
VAGIQDSTPHASPYLDTARRHLAAPQLEQVREPLVVVAGAVLVPGVRSGESTWEVHELAMGTVTTIRPENEVFLATVMLR